MPQLLVLLCHDLQLGAERGDLVKHAALKACLQHVMGARAGAPGHGGGHELCELRRWAQQSGRVVQERRGRGLPRQLAMRLGSPSSQARDHGMCTRSSSAQERAPAHTFIHVHTCTHHALPCGCAHRCMGNGDRHARDVVASTLGWGGLIRVGLECFPDQPCQLVQWARHVRHDGVVCSPKKRVRARHVCVRMPKSACAQHVCVCAYPKALIWMWRRGAHAHCRLRDCAAQGLKQRCCAMVRLLQPFRAFCCHPPLTA